MADRRPIRLVLTEDRDLSAVPASGGPRSRFKDVDESFRQSISNDLDSIEKNFSEQLTTQNLPVVATATLEGEALAKSHRPETLFTAQTCPIIGSDAIGSLRLSVTASGIRNLRRQVLEGTTQNIIADLSTLIEIRPYEVVLDSIPGFNSPDTKGRRRPLKLKIFNHRNGELNERLHKSLEAILGLQSNIAAQSTSDFGIQQLTYSSEMIVYRIDEPTEELIENLSKFVGTQSLMPLPTFSLTTQYLRKRSAWG